MIFEKAVQQELPDSFYLYIGRFLLPLPSVLKSIGRGWGSSPLGFPAPAGVPKGFVIFMGGRLT
jgi:hypothetical protein